MKRTDTKRKISCMAKTSFRSIGTLLIVLACSGVPPVLAEPPDEQETQKMINTMSDLQSQLDKLKNSVPGFKKMIRPEKDAEFLFSSAIGVRVYRKIPDSAECKNQISRLGTANQTAAYIRISWAGMGFQPRLYDNMLKKVQDGPGKLDSAYSVPIECLLSATEEALNVPANSTADTRERISVLYNKLNHPDWDSDSIRFGILMANVEKLDAISTSIAIHAFPTYRRFMPGTPDPVRRTSIIFSFGSISNAAKKVDGGIYGLGISFDIERGFALSAGWSAYQYKDVQNDSHLGNSHYFGISLTSDLAAKFK